MTIKNREQIIDELVEMLIQFDLDCNQYDTDVYLYLDDEGNAELDTFVNPGGNSWLDDDHYTVYTDKQRYEDVISNYWTTTDDIADALDMSVEQLIQEACDFENEDYDEDEDTQEYYWTVYHYINDSSYENNYCDKLLEIYEDLIRTNYINDYFDKAEYIIDRFESDYDEEDY